MTPGRAWLYPLVALAAVVYPPLLATAPGQVVADTKSYLTLDPTRLLRRAVSMWDPHVGLGTVPHQQIGYLWPMGPYYWLAERLGVPDWVAQRLWIGTIMVAAGAGVLFLCRTWRWRPSAAAAAAFVYALTPFVLTLAARISALLLPYAALPWLIALATRSLRHRGWRHPALFGLTVATVGSVNATALILVGIAPVLWILYSLWQVDGITRARVVNTLAKLGTVTVAVNLWWIGGLSVQATNGIDVLRYTETAAVVADASTAPEVLRGLGYWFFYGGDRLGPWIEPSVSYTQNVALIALTYGLATLGVLGLGLGRWRHRLFVIVLLAAGVFMSVGAYPWDSPSPLGRVFRLLLETDAGLAMRSLPRAAPLVVLALALGTGTLVAAVAEDRPRRGVGAAVAVAVLAVAALPPLWTGQFVPENLQRPESIPEYWKAAAAHVDIDDGTRVLEVPGSDFASYRWGNTVDPITPGLIDRPYVARELIPYGSAPSADLLNALDATMQDGLFEPESLAPIARLMGVGDVIARNDLQYERYQTPRPRSFWSAVRSAPGIGAATEFGVGVPNVAGPEAPLIDERHLGRDAGLPPAPAVGVLPVTDPEPIVRTHADDGMILVSGSGAGLVDLAAAGLVSGDELLRYSAGLTESVDFAQQELRGVRSLVVTDTNRKAATRWTTIRHTSGFTEQVDGGLLAPDPTDNRLPVQEHRPGTQTVARHDGLSVRATGYGNPITYTPEERPVLAADGDPTTAWRTAAFEDAVGERIELQAPEPVRLSSVRLLQPTTGAINRWITRVELRFDGRDPVIVDLDERSRRAPGQEVRFDEHLVQTLSIEIVADSAGRRPGYGDSTSVGFAEITGMGTATEVIVMPSDLLDAGGYRTISYPLTLLQTRRRSDPADVTRGSEELRMVRAFSLPTTRSFSLGGSVRLATDAPSTVVDALLGRTGTAGGLPTVIASSTLPGSVGHAPSNVLDGDGSTRWTTGFADEVDATLQVRAPSPTPIDSVRLVWVDDDDHSPPTAVRIAFDGSPSEHYVLSDGVRRSDGLVEQTLAVPPVVATTVDLEFETEPRTTIDWNSARPEALPLSVASLDISGGEVPGLRVPAVRDVDTGCRNDLLRLDGQPVRVRVHGSVADALAGDALQVEACDQIEIGGGEHVVTAADGRTTGLHLDRLVWRSGAGGGPDPAVGELLGAAAAAPTFEVTGQSDVQIDLRISGATPSEPFWVILGQSQNAGWSVISDVASEPSRLVNGYANGFLVTPDSDSFDLRLRFTPQNRVDIALLLSVLGAIAAVALAFLPATRVRPASIPRQEPLRSIRALTWEGALPPRHERGVVAAAVGIAVAFAVGPVTGIAVAAVTFLGIRREGWRWLFTLAPAVLVGGCGLYAAVHQLRNDVGPGLHWPADTGRFHDLALLGVALLVVDLVIEHRWTRRSDRH